jgi:hypothetical protein
MPIGLSIELDDPMVVIVLLALLLAFALGAAVVDAGRRRSPVDRILFRNRHFGV